MPASGPKYFSPDIRAVEPFFMPVTSYLQVFTHYPEKKLGRKVSEKESLSDVPVGEREKNFLGCGEENMCCTYTFFRVNDFSKVGQYGDSYSKVLYHRSIYLPHFSAGVLGFHPFRNIEANLLR